jgi:hypothetical protein
MSRALAEQGISRVYRISLCYRENAVAKRTCVTMVAKPLSDSETSCKAVLMTLCRGVSPANKLRRDVWFRHLYLAGIALSFAAHDSQVLASINYR